MAKTVADVITIMRRAVNRPNTTDPDSTDTVFLDYISDFYELYMSNDVKLFNEWGIYKFDTDATVTSGNYTINDTNFVSSRFTVLRNEGWVDDQDLDIYQDPAVFFERWPFQDLSDIPTGQPQEMLIFNDTLYLRPIPDDTYTVRIVAYQENAALTDTTDQIGQDFWYRYLAYGAALQYMNDFNYDATQLQLKEREFRRQRRLILQKTHTQRLNQRGKPRY